MQIQCIRCKYQFDPDLETALVSNQFRCPECGTSWHITTPLALQVLARRVDSLTAQVAVLISHIDLERMEPGSVRLPKEEAALAAPEISAEGAAPEISPQSQKGAVPEIHTEGVPPTIEPPTSPPAPRKGKKK